MRTRRTGHIHSKEAVWKENIGDLIIGLSKPYPKGWSIFAYEFLNSFKEIIQVGGCVGTKGPKELLVSIHSSPKEVHMKTALIFWGP